MTDSRRAHHDHLRSEHTRCQKAREDAERHLNSLPHNDPRRKAAGFAAMAAHNEAQAVANALKLHEDKEV